MKDARKHSSEQREFSNGTSADHPPQEKRKKLWEDFAKTAVFALAALFVIILGSIAWFTSNSRVNSGGIMISSQFDTIKLATKGSRQEKESVLLKLQDGIEVPYNNETYYCTEQGEIALRLSDPSVTVSPGMSGEISFYIIPDSTGSQTVTLHMGLAGYEEIKAESWSTGRKIHDPVLNSLLCGHILLFKSCKNGVYSDWIAGRAATGGVDYPITVTNLNAEKEVPWEVKIYWVWPLRYENMANDFVVNNENLLSDFIEAQAKNLNSIAETQYSYSEIFLTKEKNLNTVSLRSNAYNEADEYIGTKADYLYVTVQTDFVN